ncbi:MAG: DUF917 domain-containing protein [Pseudomonadota bacterium]
MKIDRSMLDDLSLGSVFLATGGGGDPYVSLLLAREVLGSDRTVPLITPTALSDDAFVATIGGVGAPSVSLELLPSVRDIVKALDAFEALHQRTLDAIVSFEVGGGNSLVPIIAAAIRGIPLVDGDGMGRALPEAQMMTFPIAGISPTPAVVIDYECNVATLNTRDPATYERHIRFLAQAMGGMITAVEHPMSGAELKRAVVPDTISFAIGLGRLLREHRGNAHQLLSPLNASFRDSIYGDAHHLFTGKVVDYETRIVGGYDIGAAVIEPFGANTEPLTLSIKNEYLMAKQGDRVLATVPDLITLLDFETAKPVNAERLRFGQRVSVIAVGCPDFYRQPNALDVVAPRCFGFDVDFRPVETLATFHQPMG